MFRLMSMDPGPEAWIHRALPDSVCHVLGPWEVPRACFQGGAVSCGQPELFPGC